MRNVIITLACVVCLSAMASAPITQSQIGTGSFSGTVSDPNGAIICGAARQFGAPALLVGDYAERDIVAEQTLDTAGA